MAGLNNKVVKNAAWIIGIRIVQSVLALVISALTARYLGRGDYGLINYAAAVVAFFVPVMQLGLSGVLVQEIVHNPEKEGKILGTSLIMSFVSSIACMLGVTAFVSIANAGEPVTIVVCVLYSIMLVSQAVEMVQYWFQAKLASKYVSIISLIAYVVISAYKIYLLAAQKSIYWFAVANALDYAMIGIALLFVYKRLSKSKLQFSFDVAKQLFSKSRYYIVSNLMITVFAQTGKIMLKLMLGNAAAGDYSLAVTCAGMTSFVFSAIIDSMRPMIFESKKADQGRFERDVSRLYSIIIYLSLAQNVVMTVFAPLIVNILGGSEYQGTIVILQVLVWYTTFSYLGSARSVWILAEDKQKYLWVINLSGAVVNVVTNLIFIPFFGAVGAAIASLVTQIFTNFIIGYIIRPISYNNKLVIKGCNPKLLFDMTKQILFKRKGEK